MMRELETRVMQTRRSFFKRLLGAAAIVALAPQIAFAIQPKEIFQYDCGSIINAACEPISPEKLKALFEPAGIFADMNAWFRDSFEAKASEHKNHGLYDWLMSK